MIVSHLTLKLFNFIKNIYFLIFKYLSYCYTSLYRLSVIGTPAVFTPVVLLQLILW